MSEVTQADVVRAYQEVARTKAGQIVFADLTRRFGFVTRSMFWDGDDGLTLAYKEGQRTVLTYIGRTLNSEAVEDDSYDSSV